MVINIFNYYHARHEMAVSAAAFGQYYARHGRYPETLAAAGLGGKISCLRYHWIDGKPLLLCKDPLLLFEHYQYDFQHRCGSKQRRAVADQPEDENMKKTTCLAALILLPLTLSAAPRIRRRRSGRSGTAD